MSSKPICLYQVVITCLFLLGGMAVKPVLASSVRDPGITSTILDQGILSSEKQLTTYLPMVRNSYPVLETGKIVFTSYQNNNEDIYRMNYDGSGVTRLTTDPATDGAPNWSPDGTQIAFDSDRTGQYEIYVMNADGSDQHKITSLGDCFSPEWSPDGSRIVFLQAKADGALIITMNPDGSNLYQVNDPSLYFVDYPHWTPDGTRISFFGYGSIAGGIYTVNTAGGELTPIYLADGIASYNWSPDGADLAITMWAAPVYNFDIYTYHLEMASLVRLTSTSRNHLMISWSPDGHQLIFHSNQDDLSNFQIYTMGEYGGSFTNLTNSPDPASWPDWTR